MQIFLQWINWLKFMMIQMDGICRYFEVLLVLNHWGRVTHIYVSKLTIIGSDNDLSPDRRQAIIWTNAGILPIGPLGTKVSDILIAICIFLFKKMHLKMVSGKWRPCCLSLNVLIFWYNSYCNPMMALLCLVMVEVMHTFNSFHGAHADWFGISKYLPCQF